MKPLLKLLLAGAVVLVAVFVGWVLLSGGRATPQPMPAPNGFEDLVAAGAAIQFLPGKPDDLAPTDPIERRSLLASNAPALRRMREGLAKESRVITTNNMESSLHLDHVSGLKRLGQLLVLEATAAYESGDQTNALNACLDLHRLGGQGTRGGLMLHGLIAVALRNMACQQLAAAPPSADGAFRREAARRLSASIREAPTADDYLANENDWRRGLPTGVRMGGLVGELFGSGTRVANERFVQRFDQLRQRENETLRDLAATAFESERGRKATDWSELVPEYLPEIPRNATNNTPLALP